MNAAAMRRNAASLTMDQTSEPEIRTTDGTIALRNLRAQIASLESRTASGLATMRERVDLIDLLALHGQAVGWVADAERAARLAEQAIQEAPTDGLARLARARVRSDDHRFADALADLDAAQQLGIDPVAIDPERVTILHALGRSDEALAVGRAAVARQPDFASLAGLAVLHAERDEIAPAEALFAASLAHYRGVSPFPVAHLDVQRGRMWQRAGDAQRARMWFGRAIRRVPAYAPAQGLLGELDAPPGEANDDRAPCEGAIENGRTDDGRDG